jgi:2-keto-4-pentenoate hydratase/2-oxohepta-3-ene-1,7-dioic acid hydratase in catechol pathway
MRLLTFNADGSSRVGVLIDGGIAELAPDLGADLRAILTKHGLTEIAERTAGLAATWQLADVELLPPIPNPGKIICVGVNYRTHRDETGLKPVEYPTLFTRFADTQIGYGASAIKPEVTSRFDYEGELAVIIGTRAYKVAPENAWDYIAGVSVYNDFTVRDWQKHSSQWIPGKNFPATGAFGPTLVTRDELADFDSIRLQTLVNGTIRQDATLADLIFGVPALVGYITRFTALAPGDVIVTGTPGGVGQFMDPPTFLQPGDVVEVQISGVGSLRNAVVDEAPTFIG